jgi:K+-sensing histidine kinase KdpD
MDNGSGISQENLQKIGKRFRTFDNQKKQNSKGLGLGLTICQEMIKVMGPYKTYQIKSELNVGTVINFFISTKE